MNLFTKPREEYTRDLNVIGNYCQQNAIYLSRMTGCSYEEALEFVRNEVSIEGNYSAKDPDTKVLAKKSPGNRQPTSLSFSRFLKTVTDKELIIAPTLTCYVSPKVKKSLIAEYITGNLKKRKDMKKLMFTAKMALDKVKESFYNLLQSTFKIKNNSISGAHASPYQILFNKSSHSTLTSTCRSATSYANAHNEKFLMGNRHYWSPEVTRANILSIIQLTDRQLFKKAMDEYNLHYPTPDEMMQCITYSTNLYWINLEEIESLRELSTKLEPIERAMFMYVGDMYHLAKHNPTVVRDMLGQISQRVEKGCADPEKYISSLNADATALVSLLCSKILNGRQLNDLKEQDPEGYAIVGATAKNVLETLEKYRTMIKGLWVTINLPPSIYKAPMLYRRCAIVSDTDSTIFTNQYWTEWFVGQIDFSEQSYAIGYTTTFLTSQIVVHYLACMSGNMGVVTEQIHQLTMKSEFYFPTLSVTTMAKNYYSYISAQEGNVFKDLEMEIKGVSLKSSNWPAAVAKRLKKYMGYIMTSVMEKGKLTYAEILDPVYEMEKEILDDIEAGGYTYLTTSQIKDSSSYVNPDSSPYVYYQMWQEVFAPKYGDCDAPPYQSIKVSVTIDKPATFKRWLEEMEDKELANRMREWAARNGKTSIGMLRLPEPILQVTGIPREIIDVIDRRTLLYNTVSGFYLVLESLGLFMMEKDRLRFVSDFYKPSK
jgi:hypothetical protein